MMRNKSVLLKWGISYLCLLLIPLLSTILTYHNDEKRLREEYMNAFDLTLSNLNTTVEALVTDMKSYKNYILENEYFDRLRQNTADDPYFRYNTFEFQSALSLYCNANNTLSCSIYFDSLNFVSSPEFGYTLPNYYARLSSTADRILPYDQWSEFFSKKYNNDFLISTALNTLGETELIYAHTVHRADKYSTVFITVPTEKLNNLLHQLPQNVIFVLQSTDGRLYSFAGDGSLLTDPVISLDDQNTLVLPNGYVSLTASPSDPGFTCHLIISELTMDHLLSGVQTSFFLTLSITLFLSILLTAILLYTNYRPISGMLAKLNLSNNGSNEFTNISSAFESLKNDYHATCTTVQYQSQELKNSRLLSLLKGRLSETDIREKIVTPTLTLDARIALIGFMLPTSEQLGEEYDNLLYFIIDNIFQELFADYVCYHIEDGRFIYYLFNLREHDDWNDYALEKTNYLCDLINQKCDFSIGGAVSEPAYHLSSCNLLYRKIMDCFDQQKYSGGSTVIDTRSMDRWQNTEQIRNLIEQDLDFAIKNGDLKAALAVSEQIFSADYHVPFQTLRVLIFDAFTLTLSIFNHYITNPIHQMTALDQIMPLMQATDAEHLKAYFEKTLVYVCGEIAQTWQSENKNIVWTVRKYVEENYADQNLNVSAIADAIERNPSYLSRVFKEITGEGLLDYINSYRIAKARELMRQDQYTLAEISEMVGYVNVRAFRRAFIKLVGELPSKYTKQ